MRCHSQPRPLRDAFIGVYLLVQLILPLKYYLSDDHFDERFAWRMFSPIRVVSCDAAFFEHRDGQPVRVRVSSDVHMSWVNVFKRARLDAIQAYAERRCAMLHEDGRPPHVTVTVRCPMPDRTINTPVPVNQNLCEVPL